MKKLYTLLLLCLMGTIASWAETETVTVKSWDFTGQAADNDVTAGTASITEANTSCTEAASPECCVGLYFQNPVKWKSYKAKENGLRNVDSGDRMCIVPNLKEGDVITITCNGTDAINTTKYAGTVNDGKTEISFTMEADGNFYFKIVKAGGIIDNANVWPTINSIVVTREVEAGTCEDPTYAISGVDGIARKFTLACTTANSSIYYSTTELEAGADGWTAYTGEETTNAETIYAYASAGGVNSNVISFTTGAGTALTLNAPTLTKTAYTDGNYTVSISSDQSNLSLVPTNVKYRYSIDNGAEVEGTSATVAAGSTITAYATSDGYTQSATSTCETAERPAIVNVWSEDYTNVTSGSGSGALAVVLNSEVDFSVGERNFYNIIGYTANNETVNTNLNTNVGINTSAYFYLRSNGNNSGILKNSNQGSSIGYIGIQNLTPGQYIVITTNGNSLDATAGCENCAAMNTTSEYYFKATASEASILFPHGTYNYVKTIAVYKAIEQITIPDYEHGYASYVTTSALDFSGVEGLKAYIGTDEGEYKLKLREVDEVPAGTPIIVKGTRKATYDIPVGTCTDEITDNLLQGSATETHTVGANESIYALKVSDGKLHSVNAGVVIPAKKAYLVSGYGGSSSAKAITLEPVDDEEEATSVVAVAADEANGASKLYNAAGQQGGAGYNGIVIDQNGNKYVK